MPSWDGGSVTALRLRPGAWRSGTSGLSTTVSRPRGLERSSPLGLLTVVDSPLVPLRHAPGLSLNAVTEPPLQLGIYTDGDGPGALTRFDGATAPLGYLDYLTSALPYHLLPQPRVLALGAGAGGDVLQALSHGARSIAAAALNPQLIVLVA